MFWRKLRQENEMLKIELEHKRSLLKNCQEREWDMVKALSELGSERSLTISTPYGHYEVSRPRPDLKTRDHDGNIE